VKDTRCHKMLNRTHIKSIKYSVVALLMLILLESIAYLGIFSHDPNFLSHYLWWIIYLDLSIASLGASLYYMMSHKSKAPCMAGMMIGMTLGMQSGMMLGAVVGATNGFFAGAMVGMIIGVVVGTWAGTVSTTMAWLQGMMSGIMGGTMGAMITVMMFTDHALIFMPFYILINIAILIGFMKMYYEEIVLDNKELEKVHIDLVTYVCACVILAAVILAIMLYGPKSALFAF